MSAALRTAKYDPRAEIMRQVGDLSRIELFHNQVLVAISMGRDQTEGGVYLPDATKRENEYQGKVGLVLKLGPLAFKDDDRNQFHGQTVKVGEWIALRPNDGWPCRLGGRKGVPCRVLEDVHVKMRLKDPEDIY